MSKFYKRVVCADGASVSIQAGKYLYSNPREDGMYYSHVEAGFPSVVPPSSWMAYADGSNDPLQDVYGYLPIALVHEFITVHGGMVSGELPPFSEES